MSKDVARKCAHSGNDGHSSGTCRRCTTFKLFGVQINGPEENGYESTMRKSKSMGNLEVEIANVEASGYASDGILHESSKRHHERKKGKPWTEEEHRSFLAGLEKLGKGNWKGISKNFVPSRKSSQVASHAQKYFIRLAAQEKKHRRASVFDIPLAEENQPSQGTPKAAEISQQAGNLAVPMKNISEVKAQVAPVAIYERPPLSPMTRRAASDSHNMAYTQRASGFARGSSQGLVPTLYCVPYPVVTLSADPRSVYMPAVHPDFAAEQRFIYYMPTVRPDMNFAAFTPRPPLVKLPPGSSQVVHACPGPNKDELNLSIRNLAL